jgi:Succinyl-CoA ligase like flavodoxin domain
VPATAVAGTAEDCGQRGVKALVVTASGLDTVARADLLTICRRHGMRLVGPTSFGVANTAISLDATVAAHHPRPGMVGLASQSTGGAGFVVIEHLSRLGVGISSLVSLGEKDDVSGTDMLRWWESDPATRLVVLYLESFGNPRKFARTARHVGREMPALTVNAGRGSRPCRPLRDVAGHPHGGPSPKWTAYARTGRASWWAASWPEPPAAAGWPPAGRGASRLLRRTAAGQRHGHLLRRTTPTCVDCADHGTLGRLPRTAAVRGRAGQP